MVKWRGDGSAIVPKGFPKMLARDSRLLVPVKALGEKAGSSPAHASSQKTLDSGEFL